MGVTKFLYEITGVPEHYVHHESSTSKYLELCPLLRKDGLLSHLIAQRSFASL